MIRHEGTWMFRICERQALETWEVIVYGILIWLESCLIIWYLWNSCDESMWIMIKFGMVCNGFTTMVVCSKKLSYRWWNCHVLKRRGGACLYMYECLMILGIASSRLASLWLLQNNPVSSFPKPGNLFSWWSAPGKEEECGHDLQTLLLCTTTANG